MAIFGRRGSSMGRVRQQAVPAPAPAKPAGRAFGGAGKGFGSVSKAPVAATPLSQQRADVRAMAASTPKGSPVDPNNNAKAAATKQFLGQQAAFHAANMANVNKAPATPQQPAFRKGGAVKKTGYAKGGMAMCGASMPPAQKRKK